MLVTELYKGQGLGNQLACYIATRVFALDKGYDFGIQSPQNFKGADLFDLDFGHTVTGGSGPEGGPAETLPEGVVHYYAERRLFHPRNGTDITIYDDNLVNVADNTKIDGTMQDEQYIIHRKEEVRQWLKVREESECFDYADDNTCVINFRGGEYTRAKDFFLRKEYWHDAIRHMLKINQNFRFIVITDDVFTAKKFFPGFDVFHFSIGKDYTIIKNAHYLILSNSSFAWFPAWLSENLKFCIAPKYWARHNISDGYWSLGYNITSGWHYLDREGNLNDYEVCLHELQDYMQEHKELYSPTSVTAQPVQEKNLRAFLKKYTPSSVKNSIKSILNQTRNFITLIRQPFDAMAEKNRRKQWLSKVQTAEYRKTIKVYDAFNFFNELELLDIRLHVLHDHVDYFVLVESTLTHSGLPKELFYENNKHLFKQFEHKILHFIIDTPLKSFEDAQERLLDPSIPADERKIVEEALSSDNIKPGQTSFLRDFYEKEYVKKVLLSLDLSDNDFCYISDLDEIWNPEAPIDYSKDDIYKYKQYPYMYYLNNRSNEDWRGWTGTIATKFKNIRNNCLNDLRSAWKTKYAVIRNGGWHFSFQGGAVRVKTKIESYSHQEINNDIMKANIEERISENQDVRGKGIKFWIDETALPKYILNNKDIYKELFK